MISELAPQIEAFLLEAHGWVSAMAVCARFGIPKRALRGLHGKPGICAQFAISGVKGYKHIKYCPDSEFNRSDRRLRNHSISQLLAARQRRRYRQRLLKSNPPVQVEKTTGQVVMPL